MYKISQVREVTYSETIEAIVEASSEEEASQLLDNNSCKKFLVKERHLKTSEIIGETIDKVYVDEENN